MLSASSGTLLTFADSVPYFFSIVKGHYPALVWLSILVGLTLIVALVAIVLFVYPNYQRQQQVEQHYQAGVAFQEASDWDKAMEAFEKVVVIDASYRDARSRLAEVRAKQQEALATAQAKAAQATAEARATVQAAAATSTVHAQATLTVQAEQKATHAAILAANQMATRTAAARDTATAATATAVAELEELKVHYQAGVVFQEARDLEKAAEEFEAVIRIDANYEDTRTRLAEVNARLQEAQATAQADRARATAMAQATATERVRATATAQAEATQIAKAAAATATAIASQRVIIDNTTHHLGDNKTGWEAPNPEGKTYFTRFWLSTQPTNDAILFLDTGSVNYANPIWINDNLVGSMPGNGDAKWDVHLKVLVLSAYLRTGENELKIEATKDSKKNFDDFMFRRLELMPRELIEPSAAPQVITIDDTVRHIGDSTASDWEVPDPESRSYVKHFELPSDPQGDGILVLKAFGVLRKAPIRVNGNTIGSLPGTGANIWTPEVAILVPESFLKAGANQLEITAGSKDNEYDDFMMKDIILRVALQ